MDLYFQHGLAASTNRTYNSAKCRYLNFCKEQHLVALPASEQQLCKFASYLAIQRLSHGTIKCYLSAVRHLHVEHDWGDPNIHEMAKLELVLRGIKRIQASERGPPKQKLPITPDVLFRILGERAISMGCSHALGSSDILFFLVFFDQVRSHCLL